MKSYTVGRNLYGTWTKNTASANLSYGDQVSNDFYRNLCALRDWPFLTRQRTLTTVASQQNYQLPYDCDLVQEISVTVSNIRYTPRQSPSQEHWDRLNLVTFSADIPQWWFVIAGQLYLWPKPSSNGNTINVAQKTRVIDLSAADYTTGTIVSIANGGTALVGSGTTWTAQMVGRFIRITYVDTANTGDGVWYEISAVPSATSITLVRAYGGTVISGGSAAYNIGQMPLLPEAFHDIPWMYGAGTYWSKEADGRNNFFLKTVGTPPSGGQAATGKIKDLISAYGSPTTDMVIDDGRGDNIVNPNLTINL